MMLCSRMFRTFFARTLPDCAQAAPASEAVAAAGWVQAVLTAQANALLHMLNYVLQRACNTQACKRSTFPTLRWQCCTDRDTRRSACRQ